MKTIIIPIFFLALVAGTIGFYLGEQSYKETRDLRLKINALRAGENGLVNPLLEYEIGSDYYTNDLKLFKKPLQELVDREIKDGKAEKIAVYYRELIGGPWIGIKEDAKFFPASLLKLPVMISYFKQSESNPSILSKKIKFDPEIINQLGDFNKNQQFGSEKFIQPGKEYTVDELIKYMIVYSDNNAKNLLILNLDDPNSLFKVYIDQGFSAPPELNSSEEILSVHEYSTFLRILYNSSYLKKDLSKRALNLLTQSTFNDGLRGGVPKEIKIAHKFGEHTTTYGAKQLHDCGIIYYPKNPYLLCVMTLGKDFSRLTNAIKDISHYVYNEVDKQK